MVFSLHSSMIMQAKYLREKWSGLQLINSSHCFHLLNWCLQTLILLLAVGVVVKWYSDWCTVRSQSEHESWVVTPDEFFALNANLWQITENNEKIMVSSIHGLYFLCFENAFTCGVILQIYPEIHCPMLACHVFYTCASLSLTCVISHLNTCGQNLINT